MDFNSCVIFVSFIAIFTAIFGQQMNDKSLDYDNDLTLDNEELFKGSESPASTRSNGSRSMFPFFSRPSLLNVVRFPNEECFDSSNQSGICYSTMECKKAGGVPSSPCARGLGSCCIVSRSCHNTTSQKVVYFKNPSYPMSDNTAQFCDLNINIYDPDICQLRLDFMDFQLDQPTLGDCMGDKFYISSSGFAPLSVPTLCGINRNQHMYISLPRDATQKSATIVFDTNSDGDYRFHLRVTQIDCNFRNKKKLMNERSSRQFGGFNGIAPYIPFIPRAHPPYSLPAPMGCLQYFIQGTGIIESFNFGEYLNNMDYGICIERQPNTCRVIFTASDYVWGMDSDQTTKDRSGVGDRVCRWDYLSIPGGSQRGDGDTYDRYCGGRLHWSPDETNDAPVISKANGPIVLRFHSNPVQPNQEQKQGFRLRFEQSSTDCMLQYNEPQPTQVAAQVVAQYLNKESDIQSIELEKHEPIVHLSKPVTPHVRSNAKHYKF